MNSSIITILKNSIQQANLNYEIEFDIEYPADLKHGDLSTNVALKSGSSNPRELANEIVEKLNNDEKLSSYVDKIEVAGPGFINFYLSDKYFLEQLDVINNKKDDFGKSDDQESKKVMVEYTDPNPFKEFHIGHLMSNTIGESISRLMAFSNNEVKRANYQGDVGIHVANSVWGLIQKMKEDGETLESLEKRELAERIKYLGQSYALGATNYKEDEEIKQQINLLNKEIYEKTNPDINEIYNTGRQWTLDYFETIYKKLGTKFDYYFFESEEGSKGKALVEEYLDDKVFEKSDGATIFKGENYGLHTRVFINSMGLPTYEAKELGLAFAKYDKYPYDMSFIVTANEISEYFKVLLKALSLIDSELSEKTTHIAHGMMKLTSGKMSSRTGKIISGEDLINEVIDFVKEKMEDKAGEIVDGQPIEEIIAVAAIKYYVLKQNTNKDIIFDPKQSISVEGNTGPYLQYTYARAKSVLNKGDFDEEKIYR